MYFEIYKHWSLMMLYVVVTFYLILHLSHGSCEIRRHPVLSRLFSLKGKPFKAI